MPAARRPRAAAGHWLHADQPSGFLAAIDDFLADP
jgi:pimeloyl-ACP methyl ester carboxylesterase